MSEKTMKKKCQKCQSKSKEQQEKERAINWLIREIKSREYTNKEMHEIYCFIKQGNQKEALKILLKGHQCPITCYCQKPAKTWQEKIQKGNELIQLAEKEISEAEKLRIRQGTELLLKHFNS